MSFLKIFIPVVSMQLPESVNIGGQCMCAHTGKIVVIRAIGHCHLALGEPLFDWFKTLFHTGVYTDTMIHIMIYYYYILYL